MADQERNLNVNLRFGVDAATHSKAVQSASKLTMALDKLDQTSIKLMRAGMGLREIGDVFGSKMLSDVGKLTQAFGGLANSISDVRDLAKSLSKSPILMAGGFIGATALIGKTVSDTVTHATGGSTTEDRVSALQRVQDALAKLPADVAAQKLEEFRSQIKTVSTADDVARVNTFADGIEKLTANMVGANDPLLQLATRFKQIQDAANSFTVYDRRNDKLLPRIESYGQEQAQQLAKRNFDAIGAKIQAAATLQSKLADASKSYHAAQLDRAKSLGALEADIANKRAAAASSLAADLQKMESDYYANRLRMAQSFGLETTRLEQDHQRDMRRAAEEHNRRLSKLADSRDALGIEDEMQSYETERRNAEEDYQTQAQRRNQDFAQQLRDLEQSFRQQRQTRIDQYNQQLIELNTYLTAQRKIIADQFAAIAKAVMDAFTGASQQYTQATGGVSGTSTNNTTNTNRSVTQNNNFGAVSDPNQIKALVYKGITEAFGAAA